mgnify:CR=1 FL=1
MYMYQQEPFIMQVPAGAYLTVPTTLHVGQ